MSWKYDTHLLMISFLFLLFGFLSDTPPAVVVLPFSLKASSVLLTDLLHTC